MTEDRLVVEHWPEVESSPNHHYKSDYGVADRIKAENLSIHLKWKNSVKSIKNTSR